MDINGKMHPCVPVLRQRSLTATNIHKLYRCMNRPVHSIISAREFTRYQWGPKQIHDDLLKSTDCNVKGWQICFIKTWRKQWNVSVLAFCGSHPSITFCDSRTLVYSMLQCSSLFSFLLIFYTIWNKRLHIYSLLIFSILVKFRSVFTSLQLK